MDLTPIRVDFTDAHLLCTGRMETGDNSEFVAVDDDGTIKVRSPRVMIYIESDGELHNQYGMVGLEPGTYVVQFDGLYRRIDGAVPE